MPTSLELLYSAEYFLRRHLQSTSSTPSADVPDVFPFNTGDGTSDPNNTFTHTTTTTTTATPNNDHSSQLRGRTILTILYLCVLGLCFVVPVFYYFRLHCFEEQARRDLEADFTTALEQSEQHREETRAARRKYIEERRARIVQLFGPVRMILKAENFPHLVDPENAPLPSSARLDDIGLQKAAFNSATNIDNNKSDESVTMASEEVFSPYTSEDDDNNDEDHAHVEENALNNNNNQNIHNTGEKQPNCNDRAIRVADLEAGVIETRSEDEDDDDDHNNKNNNYDDDDDDDHNRNEYDNNAGNNTQNEDSGTKKKDLLHCHNPYGDEDTFFIRIPVPGLPLDGSSLLDPSKPLTDDMKDREMRLAPGLCSICLSNYKVGSDIVWSSNVSCDHHFHANCIEKWLMKQREGPLCPCCRRDFIVDPFDLLEEEGDDNRGETGALPVFQWDPTYLELNRSSPENVNDNNNNNNNNNNNLNGDIVVTAPGDDATNTRSAADGVATTGVAVSNLEEGQRSMSEDAETSRVSVEQTDR